MHLLFNLATSGDRNTFPQALALYVNANLTTTDKTYNPNWIDLSTIPHPKDGEAEKKKSQGQIGMLL